MKKIALLIALQAVSFGAMAETNMTGYAIDARGIVVRNNFGECVRTNYWRAENAIPECEGGMAKPVPVAAPAPAPVAVPAPAPAPRAVVPAPVVVAPRAVPVPAPAPIPAPAVKAAKKISLGASTSFAIGKSVLAPAGKAAVDADVMSKLDGFSKVESVTIEGHADPMGKESLNVSLSKSRAEAVKAYMVSKGVKADVITTTGKGSSEPLANVKCDAKLAKAKLSACYAPLRRIEVEVKGVAK